MHTRVNDKSTGNAKASSRMEVQVNTLEIQHLEMPEQVVMQ